MSSQPVYLDENGDPIKGPYLDDEGNPTVGASVTKKGIPSSWDAFLSYLSGAKSLATGPFDMLKGIGREMSDPTTEAGLMGAAPGGGPLAALMALGKMGKTGQEQQTQRLGQMSEAGGLQGVIGQILSLVNKSPIPTDRMVGVPTALSAADLAGSAGVLGGVDFDPSQAMEMSRALKSGDIAGFMQKLGSTTAQIGSLGLTGKPGALGRALGMKEAGKVAPGAAGSVSGKIADASLDTSKIKSDILRSNVFPGGPNPARSMPVPELDLPVTLGEGSGNVTALKAEQALASSLPAAGLFEKVRSARAQKIYDYGNTVGRYISKDVKTAEGGPAAVSMRVQNRIAEAKQVLAQNRDAAYLEVWQDPSLLTSKGAAKKFSLKGTAAEKIADEFIPKLEALESRIGTEGPALKVLRSFKDPAQRWVTLETLQNLKQAAFNSAESAKLGLSSGAAKKLTGAIDDTIREIIGNAGGKKLTAKWELAKAKHQQLSRLDEDRFVNGVLNASRDSAYDLIKGGSIQDLDTVWKLLKPSDKQLVKARWIQDVVDNAGNQPAGNFKKYLATLTGFEGSEGAFATASGKQTLSAAKVKSGLESIGGEKFQRLFTESEREAINTFANAVEKYGKGSVKNTAGAVVNSVLIGGLMHGVATGNLGRIAQMGGVAAGTRLLGYAFTNPRASKSLTGLVEALGKASEAPFNDPSVMYWSQRLSKDLEDVKEE